MTINFPEFHIPGLRHLISTREGGVSEGGFASLNLGYHVGDVPERVTENRRRLGLAAGYNPELLVAAQQVHGTVITEVGAGDRGRGAFSWDSAIPDTDGLLVREAGVPVAIQVADCAAVLIVDPVQHVLAAVHAGWRGALGGIAGNAVRRMTESGSDPADIRVGVGPTLCPACLEVSEQIADEVERALGQGCVVRKATPHLDIRAMLATDLARAGVKATQIVHAPACTKCQVDKYFSHRGQNGKSGRFALVAWWED